MEDMKWKNIKKLPKNKSRPILFAWWGQHGLVESYLADNYEDALTYRAYGLKNDFTHWMYIEPPKD